MDYPPLTIVMTTYITEPIRKHTAEVTLETWQEYLRYDGEIILCVSDDGSTLKWNPKKYWSGTILHTRQERHGVGASLNAGFKKAFEISPLVLYAVDDWQLLYPFDVTPWCRALLEREDIGIMRLGPPHPFLRGKVDIVTEDWQGWALNLERYGLVVGHRPEIFHQRMIDALGWFEEDINACEVERRYTVRWANTPTAPGIFLALPHPWFTAHSDKVPSLSEMEPR